MPRKKPTYRPAAPAPTALRRGQPQPVPVPPSRRDTRTNHRSRHEERRGAGTARTRSDLTRTSTALPPELTDVAAYEFVQLLHAGLGGRDAMAFLAPEWAAAMVKEPGKLDAVVTAWARSRLVLAAATKLNHGAWHHLDPEARLAVALDKHYAELAYFLYTHDWATLDGTDLRRATDAREAIAKKLEGRTDADDSPMMAFMRALQDGSVRFDKPVQLDNLGPRTPEAAAERRAAKARTSTDPAGVKLTKGES